MHHCQVLRNKSFGDDQDDETKPLRLILLVWKKYEILYGKTSIEDIIQRVPEQKVDADDSGEATNESTASKTMC